MPVRNLFFRYFPSPDFGGGAGVGVDFFITCTENAIPVIVTIAISVHQTEIRERQIFLAVPALGLSRFFFRL